MSQTKFVETVELWTTEECQQNLSSALPKLINCLKEEHNTSLKETLKVLFSQLVPHLSLQDSEEKLFNKISEWLKNFFRSSFELIKKHITNKLMPCCELIKPVIEELCFIMDCFACYIESIFTKQKDVYIRHVSSLCTVTLFIVSSSYGHCKRSVEIYGKFLETMNESLTFLFTKTGDLLTKLNVLLHNMLVQSSSDLHFVLSILDGLKQIGEIVFDVDIRMMAAVWRLYIKIAIDQEELIKQVLEVGPTIEVLISQLLNRLEKLQHLDEEITFVKLTRMCGFLLKVIVLLCDKYGGHLGTCQKNLCNLILYMYRISPPSLAAVSSTQNLNPELTVGIEPLVEKLIQDYSFLHFVLEEPQNDFNGFERCILLLSILEKLPRLKKRDFDQWMSQISGNKLSCILSAVFNILPSCHVELTLPVYLSMETSQDEPKRLNVTLYEYTHTKLCRFIACLPARHFLYLEQVLINNLLNPNFWTRQMAMDVWTFVGRYSSPNLCFHHCCILSSVVAYFRTSTSVVAAHVECLWNRLIHVLLTDHLDQFLTCHSKLVATGITISKRSPARLIYPVKILYEKSISTLNIFIKSPSDVSEVDLITSFQAAYKILQADRIHLTKDDVDKVASLTRIAASLHKPRHTNSLLKYNSSVLMEKFLLLTGELIHSFTNDEIFQVLNSLDVGRQSLSNAARKHATKILKNLKHMENGPFLAVEISDLISQSFATLLQDPNWIVLDSALDAFTSFAHETIHTTVISKTTARSALIQEHVTAYLNRSPWTCDSDPISFLKRQKIEITKHDTRYTSFDAPTAISNQDQERIKITLKAIQSNVENLLEFSAKQPLPNWAKKELNQIQDTLQSISN